MGEARSTAGTVSGLFRKAQTMDEAGLPKHPVEQATVGPGGVLGDFNRYRHDHLHDDPDSALLIVPEEMVAQLQSEGWPVHVGDLGENISTRGIPYEEFRVGETLTIGEVRAVITRPCDPCTNLYALPYVGEHDGPRFVKTLVNRRGWYARVVLPGTVHEGDRVQLG